MAGTATSAPASSLRLRPNVQQRAWFVLLLAFISFCVVCALSAFGVQYFLFQSTISLSVALDVSRGTPSYVDSDPIEKVVPRDVHFMSSNERVSTDSQSQATIMIRDPFQGNRLIASVTMKRDTNVGLSYAIRPRFDWSTLEYQIDLTRFSGELDIYVPPGLPRALNLIIESENGPVIYLKDSGQYSVNANINRVLVTNRAGRAILTTTDFSTGLLIPEGQRGAVNTDNPGQVVLSESPLNLLQSGVIQTLPPDEVESAVNNGAILADLMRPWQCGDINSQPPGRFDVGVAMGRPAVRLVRGGGAENHGETFCSQLPSPGQQGRDVSAYNQLVLKTTFLIDGHSVLLCGVDGSECPLTLQLDYIYLDALGNPQPGLWWHGFYANTNAQVTWPPRCSGCLLDHDQVYLDRWYTYDSGNLFDLLDAAGTRPVSILRVRFYASGHEYDVYVGDMALFAS